MFVMGVRCRDGYCMVFCWQITVINLYIIRRTRFDTSWKYRSGSCYNGYTRRSDLINSYTPTPLLSYKFYFVSRNLKYSRDTIESVCTSVALGWRHRVNIREYCFVYETTCVPFLFPRPYVDLDGIWSIHPDVYTFTYVLWILLYVRVGYLQWSIQQLYFEWVSYWYDDKKVFINLCNINTTQMIIR